MEMVVRGQIGEPVVNELFFSWDLLDQTVCFQDHIDQTASSFTVRFGQFLPKTKNCNFFCKSTCFSNCSNTQNLQPQNGGLDKKRQFSCTHTNSAAYFSYLSVKMKLTIIGIGGWSLPEGRWQKMFMKLSIQSESGIQ